jgi:hypothetical protein
VKGYRLVAGEGLEGYCPRCREWWPVPSDRVEFLEIWPARTFGFGVCRACWREIEASRTKVYREAPEVMAKHRALERERYHAMTPAERADYRAARAVWREATKAERYRKGREYRDRNRLRLRAYRKAYYAANRDRLRALERARHAARKALKVAA